ncbi:hypothetical protein Pla52n_37600 [Stieleria varia]|uniref:Uncharacterized protein n=1 Tax=Stieleria varia TaxID=2528005 RepID=A0A5C6AUK7_9BACT|nr:hypothetical protein Pla52n_37600 [Stieleria varia]
MARRSLERLSLDFPRSIACRALWLGVAVGCCCLGWPVGCVENTARRRQQAAERRQIASGPPRAVGYTKRFMLSLLRSFWADSRAETWGWHPMLYAVAAPQLSELTRGALASPRPQAVLFNHIVIGLENKCPLSLPKSSEAMIATWISRHLFSARPES